MTAESRLRDHFSTTPKVAIVTASHLCLSRWQRDVKNDGLIFGTETVYDCMKFKCNELKPHLQYKYVFATDTNLKAIAATNWLLRTHLYARSQVEALTKTVFPSERTP